MDRIGGRDVALTAEVLEWLRERIRQVTGDLRECRKKSRDYLEVRRRELDDFSIVLFGRTMAGKSTLMEILTRGDGASIGKGAQRTTRDVRHYRWRGLKVTDVPGVAAFEGADDENLAFAAAAKADLVLFLISDDAPQPVEAECLARIRALGKPILGICNVKVSIEDEDDLFLFLRSPEKWFDKERLIPLIRQFHAFIDRHTPGYHVWFIFTHLWSRFLAMQPAFRDHSHDLERASRFRLVEERIVSEVIGRGKFLRTRSFIDGAAAPMLELAEWLLDTGERTSSQLRVLEDKQTQASDRVSEFERYGRERIEKFISGQISSIHDEIPSFSEENYDRGDAGERWSEFLESRNLERKAEKLAEKLSDDFRREVAELAREIEAETGFADDFAAARRISMGSVFDGMRAWKWTTISLSSVLAIAAVFLVSGPLGWASVAVGVVGWLVSQCLDDREAKVRRQRSELARRLRGNADEIERRLRKHLLRWFTEELLPEAGRLLRDLSAVTEALFELAHRQRELAWTLNRELKKLHRALVLEALAQLGRPDLIASTRNLDFARVPGLAVMLLIPPGMKFPEEVRAALGDLLGERIWFVVDTDDRISILRQAIGMDCDRYRISIDEENRVARVTAGEIDAVGVSRMRLAQQLTELHVMK